MTNGEKREPEGSSDLPGEVRSRLTSPGTLELRCPVGIPPGGPALANPGCERDRDCRNVAAGPPSVQAPHGSGIA
jgi:hypothetical protein